MSRIFIKTKNIIWEHLYIVLKILLACTLTQSPWSTCSSPLFYPPHLLSSPGRYPISLSPILVSTVGAVYLPSWSGRLAQFISHLGHGHVDRRPWRRVFWLTVKKHPLSYKSLGFISRPSQGALKKKHVRWRQFISSIWPENNELDFMGQISDQIPNGW